MTKYPGYRTMTAAQRYNARYDRIWDEAKRRDPEIFGLNRLATDQKTVAERKWQTPKLAPKPQKAMDIGLFSDDANQLDLVEMFQDPTND